MYCLEPENRMVDNAICHELSYESANFRGLTCSKLAVWKAGYDYTMFLVSFYWNCVVFEKAVMFTNSRSSLLCTFKGLKQNKKQWETSSNSSYKDKSCRICDSPLGFHLTKACSQQALRQISSLTASSKDYKKDTPIIYMQSMNERNTSNCFHFLLYHNYRVKILNT